MPLRRPSPGGLFAALLFLSASSLRSPGEIQTGVEVLPFDATWDWLMIIEGTAVQVDPATRDPDFLQTWLNPGYNTLPFRQSPGPLSYGGIQLFDSSTLPPGSAMNSPAAGSRGTVYFRTALNLTGALTHLHLDVLADDGLILYVDGVQWLALNMPPGATSDFNQLSASVGNEGALIAIESTDGGLTPLPSLASGLHTIHVSVHNANIVSSSDLGFAFRIIGDLDLPPPPPPPSPSLAAVISTPSLDGSPRVLVTAKNLDPATTYIMQVSTDLTNWSSLNTFPPLAERTTFSLDVPSTSGRRYFRLAK